MAEKGFTDFRRIDLADLSGCMFVRYQYGTGFRHERDRGVVTQVVFTSGRVELIHDARTTLIAICNEAGCKMYRHGEVLYLATGECSSGSSFAFAEPYIRIPKPSERSEELARALFWY